MTPSLLASLKQLLSKYVQSSQVELQTITRGVLESWGAVPYSVSATTASTEVDLARGPLIEIDLTESTTLSFTGGQTGVYVFKIKQGSVGSKTITWPSSVKWSGASAPTLTTTANAWDFVTLVYDGNYFSGTSTLNFVV